MVGHDLRNPLTGIKNSTYFLRKKGRNISESQSTEMLDTIDKCLDYSNKIISDLLDYSREIHLDRKLYSPRLIVEECLILLVKPEKMEIINLVSDEPKIWVDPDKMRRVFINLIKNGLDAMQNVGTLTIESKEVKSGLEISFTDTGIGISNEVLPKLFTPLFTTKAKGMGFGLAICKRIIEAHGGTINVKTASGIGTTFKIILSDQKNSYGGERIWVEMPKSSLLTTTKTLEKQ
jgi:signal transduction histidine kinase